MNYPHTIRTLIIEDDGDMVQTYERLFTKYRDQGFDIEEPCIAWSYKDGEAEIKSDSIFHLAILDLKLPDQANGDPEGGSTRGLGLLQQLTERDHCPVPVILIITGDQNRIESVGQVTEQIREHFYKGEIIGKNANLGNDLQRAFQWAWNYAGFGVIAYDEAEEPRPPLLPREVDLMRRCGLEDTLRCGIDLRWWSADKNDFGAGTDTPEWVKVLHGRFLLTGRAGYSRPHFFKLESAGNGQGACASARHMANKLQHVRVVGHLKSQRRNLLITDKAGSSNVAPVALPTFLCGGSERVMSNAHQIASDIAQQLGKLSGNRVAVVNLGTLFWNYHTQQLPQTEAAWRRYGNSFGDESSSTPTEVLKSFLRSEQSISVTMCDCVHGDLHLGNVSLDADVDEVNYHAYIIDAGPMKSGVIGKDLAALEISLILHQKYEGNISLVEAAKSFYEGADTSADHGADLSLVHYNTLTLLTEVRREALKECSEEIYACLLFDHALIQLGSLAYGTSQNKIVNAKDAALLCHTLAGWVEHAWQQRRDG